MTPRNLVPATPMRFSGATEPKESTVTPQSQRSKKDKSSIPLPPGYVDRSAQRRSGLDSLNLNIFNETEIEKESKTKDEMQKKLEFLDETAGIEEFPSCSQVQTERIMKLVLKLRGDEVKNSNSFKDNEAFLQFKSIEESKTQPFDPFHRPRRVFRASGLKDKSSDFEDDLVVLERVKEAVKRFEIASERHQKYLETLNQNSETIVSDIFPEVGIFDEKATLELAIAINKTSTNQNQTGKEKAKNRLFASKTFVPKVEKDVDVFELIAQKSLDTETKTKVEESSDGGLFGFSNILPKLSRLESENGSKGNDTKLTGAYASILSDEEQNNNDIIKKTESGDKYDDYLYPGYLENDPSHFDSDEEIPSKDLPKNKRKLARKEDKEAAKVEKIVKSKFGVDLSK